MRRRRQKNPLLFKMIGVGLLVTIPLLFLLAQFGVFKSIQQHYLETTLVNLPPPPPEPKEPKPKTAKAHPHVEAHHQTNNTHATQRSAPLPVHVAAASPGPAAATDNAIVNGSGGLPPGQLPVTLPAPAPPMPTPVATPPPAPPVVTAPPVPAAPAPPAAPTVVAAQLVADPKPVLPDQFLDSELDATFRAVFTIHADGSTDVKMVDSTGNEQLDQLALDAARQWKFRPALRDGQPVDSYQRLVVEFQVS